LILTSAPLGSEPLVGEKRGESSAIRATDSKKKKPTTEKGGVGVILYQQVRGKRECAGGKSLLINF